MMIGYSFVGRMHTTPSADIILTTFQTQTSMMSSRVEGFALMTQGITQHPFILVDIEYE